MPEIVDVTLLRFFIQISHWVQIRTGWTNFFLAKMCVRLIIISCILAVFDYWIPILGYHPHMIMTVINAFTIFLCIGISHMCDDADNLAFFSSNQKSILRKRFELILCPPSVLRLMVICISIYAVGYTGASVFRHMDGVPVFRLIAGLFGWPMWACFFYFVMVDPLPPGKCRRVKSFSFAEHHTS